MLGVGFSSSAKKFLKKVEKQVAVRLVDRVEKLALEPFPTDVKRVQNQKEKVFRVRVGDYRIQYSVLYEQNLLFVSDIDKRPRAY
ncbi:MAG TPA: type II toxin-antitoxin system RelE/ParE family toxin [Candidatus Nanoarchaeia archaeon]|nr:type II toxin-antitoxin system RelE/ParE family toxin [Candidatus Nanoarchaeia archaeon]